MKEAASFSWPNGKQAALSLSFDDARASQLDAALPLLDRANLKATFYINFNLAKPRLKDWQTVAANGHEIGNHSVYHPCAGNFAWGRHVALEDYTLEQMQREHAAETEINRHLRLEIDTLRSPIRIERLATDRLHMVAPGPDEASVVELVLPAAPPPPSVVARR